MHKDDGGPAFPNKGDNSPGHEIYDGMSLRDLYGGLAMMGLLARGENDPGHVAPAAMTHANAMLVEREKRQAHDDDAPPHVPFERLNKVKDETNAYALLFLRNRGHAEAADALERDLEIPF